MSVKVKKKKKKKLNRKSSSNIRQTEITHISVKFLRNLFSEYKVMEKKKKRRRLTSISFA